MWNMIIEWITLLVKVVISVYTIAFVIFLIHSVFYSIDKDHELVSSYFVELGKRNTKYFDVQKQFYIDMHCDELEATPNRYSGCTSNISDIEYLSHKYDLHGAIDRIELRNDSFMQWRWLGRDPIKLN